MKENKEHELCSEETVEEIEQEDLEQAVDQDEQKSEDQIELLTKQWEQERDGLVNQLLRLKADFDNYKRRSEASIEAIRATANQNLMAELLPVIDNFERTQCR